MGVIISIVLFDVINKYGDLEINVFCDSLTEGNLVWIGVEF